MHQLNSAFPNALLQKRVLRGLRVFPTDHRQQACCPHSAIGSRGHLTVIIDLLRRGNMALPLENQQERVLSCACKHDHVCSECSVSCRGCVVALHSTTSWGMSMDSC